MTSRVYRFLITSERLGFVINLIYKSSMTRLGHAGNLFWSLKSIIYYITLSCDTLTIDLIT